jgi:protoporphyrinogen oxidase
VNVPVEPELRGTCRGGACVAIIGGGPAGLTAAYELQKLDNGYQTVLLEAGEIVGGIARTETYKGFRFDIGGHRFFTKCPEIQETWEEVLGSDFITRPRRSRIYYRGRYYDYPLKIFNALRNIGPYEATRIVLSYLKWQLKPYPREESFEEWVINRFGGRLYMHFFRSYTRKVWGIDPKEIQAEWAAQRIRNLSLHKAVLQAFTGANDTASLIEEFQYPRLGPGMMWEKVSDLVRRSGGDVRLRSAVRKILRDGSRVTGLEIAEQGPSGTRCYHLPAEHFISSMALRDLIESFDPPPPGPVREAAARLKYRDFLIVTLVLDRPDPFPDNWIYVHSSDVRVGRIQNFRAWSPEMIPNDRQASIGMEYFCRLGDELWLADDAALIRDAASELEKLGLAQRESVVDGTVIRQPKAYPVYDGEYKAALAVISDWIKTLENFQTVGRNGLHRYNNQDHSMLSAMLAARNIAGEKHDVWSVNIERSYHEEFQRPNSRVGQVAA